MPRSFLVKKHLSHKKPNYGMLDLKKHDPDMSPTNTESTHAMPNTLHPLERRLPGPCLMASALNSSLESKPIHPPVVYTQPPQHNSLPLESSVQGHTYQNAFRDSHPVHSLQDSVKLQSLKHSQDLRLLEGRGVPTVPLPLLGLAAAGSGQERFECFDCRKAYFTFSGLAKHKQLHCEWQCLKYFSCKYCDKEYVSLGALKMHIRTHTLPCVCKLCGKAFSRPWLLQGHIRTHTGEKPFSCSQCSRAFADRSNLRAHLQTHSDIKKYQCKSCSKTFSRISLLSKHEEAGCCPMS
ncbi:zinc finger protein SNAI3 [Chanos chanos]|uniref:Zinc finger protein SNAI2 n=1 Tax=Chanos chanos TaxID=29144 RepID=A0A6J2WZU3_CHACN|nr:zinc finger protein SNAI3 [Chanos chanos]